MTTSHEKAALPDESSFLDLLCMPDYEEEAVPSSSPSQPQPSGMAQLGQISRPLLASRLNLPSFAEVPQYRLYHNNYVDASTRSSWDCARYITATTAQVSQPATDLQKCLLPRESAVSGVFDTEHGAAPNITGPIAAADGRIPVFKRKYVSDDREVRYLVDYRSLMVSPTQKPIFSEACSQTVNQISPKITGDAQGTESSSAPSRSVIAAEKPPATNEIPLQKPRAVLSDSRSDLKEEAVKLCRGASGEFSSSCCDNVEGPKEPRDSAHESESRSKASRRKKQKKVLQPRVALQTRTDTDILDDGYKWRKYGQKAVKNNIHPRSYYRCTHHNCSVKKRVERCVHDPGLVMTTYQGVHNHHCESPATELTSPSLIHLFPSGHPALMQNPFKLYP